MTKSKTKLSKPWYDGSNLRGLHLRAIVTQSGDIIAKNYDSREVLDKSVAGKSGDIGVTVRVDGYVDSLTPAQRHSLQDIARGMSETLQQRVGIETTVGFKPGTAVRANPTGGGVPVLGIVEGMTDSGLYLRAFADDCTHLKRVFVPMSAYYIDEATRYVGVDGLFRLHCKEMQLHADFGFYLEDVVENFELTKETLQYILEELPDGYLEDYEGVLEKLADPARIARAVASKNCRYRKAAIALTDDIVACETIALDPEETIEFREVATNKFEDEEFLAKVAIKALDYPSTSTYTEAKVFREGMLERISRKEVMFQLMLEGLGYHHAEKLPLYLGVIGDQELLFELASKLESELSQMAFLAIKMLDAEHVVLFLKIEPGRKRQLGYQYIGLAIDRALGLGAIDDGFLEQYIDDFRQELAGDMLFTCVSGRIKGEEVLMRVMRTRSEQQLTMAKEATRAKRKRTRKPAAAKSALVSFL